MRILVIGGSYFLGRWFVQYAHKKHDVTVFNRGNIPIGLSNVTEVIGDRHNDEELCKLNGEGCRYDAVVDFCAYKALDIKRVLECLSDALPERYIYISTVDVYKKGLDAALDESAELVDLRTLKGDEAEYIRGKTELERELKEECKRYGIHCVSVRPVILYGPLNYAPRESVYLEWIRRAGQIIHPADADGYFQMLYVSDAAKALLKLCEKTEDLREAYNFCTDEILTYDTFEQALDKACMRHDPSKNGKDAAFERVNVDVKTILEQNIPLPFPLTKGESGLYSGGLFKELGVDITPLEDGLTECMRVG